MGELNKGSSVALYQQLVDEIKASISSGQLSEGDRIMTEAEFSKIYNISRITVRKAIEILVEEGILVKKQGIGTFVASKKLTRNIGVFMGFSQNCEANGQKPGTKLLTAALTDPDGSDEKYLGIGENEKVILIRRLRLIDEQPVILEENHFPQSYAFLLGENMERSLYGTLGERGIQTYGGKRRVSVCYATPSEAETLGVKKGSALLLMKDICMNPDGEVIHTCKSLICPERYEIVINTMPDYIR